MSIILDFSGLKKVIDFINLLVIILVYKNFSS